MRVEQPRIGMILRQIVNSIGSNRIANGAVGSRWFLTFFNLGKHLFRDAPAVLRHSRKSDGSKQTNSENSFLHFINPCFLVVISKD